MIADLTLLALASIPLDGDRDLDGLRFGRAVCTIPDQDGDGLEDFVVTEPFGPSGPGSSGTFYVFSSSEPRLLSCVRGPWPGAMLGGRVEWLRRGEGGALLLAAEYGKQNYLCALDGTPLRRFEAELGAVLGAGDWDCDGFDDLAAERTGRVVVLSGRTFEPIHSLPEWCSAPLLGSPGDLDGDERGELVVASVEREPLAALVVFSGIASAPLPLRIPDPEGPECDPPQRWVVAPAGDFDGDGRGDLAVGFPKCSEGRVLVFSGSDGSVLLLATPPGPNEPGDSFVPDFGYSVLGGRDLNGDGLDDVVIGRPYDFLVPALVRAYALGRTEPLWTIQESDRRNVSSNVGTGMAFLPDRDADGVAELLVTGTDYWDDGAVRRTGNVRIVSGATGKEIWFLHETDLPTFDRGSAK